MKAILRSSQNPYIKLKRWVYILKIIAFTVNNPGVTKILINCKKYNDLHGIAAKDTSF